MPRVEIDGVLYVPVSEAHIGAAAIEDAIVSDWAGDDWREPTRFPDAPTYLRIQVSDGFEDGEGMTVTEFIAKVLSKLQPS